MFLSTVATLTLQVKVVKLSETSFCFASFFYLGKCEFYLLVFGLQTFESQQFYKVKKKSEFGALETMAANKKEHETFSGVISFEEMNFSKSTTENNSANNLPLLKMKKRRQIYMICKEIYHIYGIQSLWCFFQHIITGPCSQ